MSSLSKATTFRVEKIEKHPNADALDIITVDGFPSIVKRGEYSVGEIAVFIPPDMVVPDTEEYAFLKGKRRIRAIKLRGVFSAGLVVKTPKISCDVEGIDVTEMMGIKSYESFSAEERPQFKSDWAPTPPGTIKYTDIESLRKYHNVLQIGEEVIITEKLHGANARFYLDADGNFHVGSRNGWLKEDENNTYWKLEKKFKFKDILAPGFIYFGEVLGVQDLKYGFAAGDPEFALFDIYNVGSGQFLDWDDLVADAEYICGEVGCDFNPILYKGPWQGFDIHKHLAEGNTLIDAWGEQNVRVKQEHIREGFVVRPVKERYDHKVGRVILKLHSEAFLLRKDTKVA